jgi:hypothetical protein
VEGNCYVIIKSTILNGLRKTSKLLSKNSLSVDQDSNMGHPEYEGMPATLNLNIR